MQDNNEQMASLPLSADTEMVPLRRQIEDEDEVEVAPPNENNNLIQPRIPESIREHFPQIRRSYQLFQSTGAWRKGNYAIILYFLPLSIALFIVLLVDWKRECDKPLKLWASTQLCLQFISLFVNAFIILKLPPMDTPIDYQERRLKSLQYFFLCNRILLILWVTWFLIGMGWSFEALIYNSCPSTAPFLFRICFSIVLTQLVIFGIILMFCCCACLMAGLRIFVYLPGETTTSSRGATESMIRALPYKKIQRWYSSKGRFKLCNLSFRLRSR